ncbi:STM3941 family protein [Streptomyces sp. Ru72]|uniref:STM3941 family protein n=1 Tax=Streptomyces sp. Ru72 TaxID=2080747 RepID=UPI002156568C|nr:STM3941 family protein [Streptomyces sp. Ru72]
MTTEAADRAATTYPSSLRRTSLTAFGSLAFVALGVWLLIDHATLKGVLAGAAAVLFFGLCACVAIGRLLRRRPELVLTGEGLTHVMLGSIRWTEIAEVTVREIRVRSTSQRVIELVLNDPDAYLARAPRTARIAGKANLRFGYSPATISATTLPVDLDEVVAAMRRHHPELRIRR